MNTQTHVGPEPKHIWPFLAWTFGITWGAWLLQYILTALKLTSGAEPLGFALNFIGGFGPTLGTFISLKISHPKKMLDFIFSHAKGWWIYMLAFCLVRVLTLFIANPALPPLNAAYVSARALAPLRQLMAYLHLHLAPTGTAFLMKGRQWQAEVEDAKAEWSFDYVAHPSRTQDGAVTLEVSGVSHGAK